MKKYENVSFFLRLIGRLNQDPMLIENPKFPEEIESSLDWRAVEEEDIFFMSYYAWLKAKITKKGLYAQTLELIQTPN